MDIDVKREDSDDKRKENGRDRDYDRDRRDRSRDSTSTRLQPSTGQETEKSFAERRRNDHYEPEDREVSALIINVATGS
jgi:hypothetical protein